MSVAYTESKIKSPDDILTDLSALIRDTCEDYNLSLFAQIKIEHALDHLVARITYAMLYEREYGQ